MVEVNGDNDGNIDNNDNSNRHHCSKSGNILKADAGLIYVSFVTALRPQ